MSGFDARSVDWVAGNILPHERELRKRLLRLGTKPEEIDDIVQETYLHIAELPSVTHIRDGRAYLFTAARGSLLKRIRHERVVRIDQLIDREMFDVADDGPYPERRITARQELAHVASIIQAFPPRCRQVFELRRIAGMSQRAVAELLDIPEHTVEQEIMKGLRRLIAGMRSIGERTEGRTLKKRAIAFARRGERRP